MNETIDTKLTLDDFSPATSDEKQSLVVMRESVNFWMDGLRRLRKNKIAMVSLFFILLIVVFAYVLPSFWPYTYDQQIKYSENLSAFEYGKTELQRIEAGEKVFPHICGTDKLGRDFAVRLMMATRISLTVGIMCSILVLLIGATFGAVAGFAGGWVDNIIEFDGTNWSLMDPTLGASNNKKSVEKYIGDGSNYVVKYSY